MIKHKLNSFIKTDQTMNEQVDQQAEIDFENPDPGSVWRKLGFYCLNVNHPYCHHLYL